MAIHIQILNNANNWLCEIKLIASRHMQSMVHSLTFAQNVEFSNMIRNVYKHSNLLKYSCKKVNI